MTFSIPNRIEPSATDGGGSGGGVAEAFSIPNRIEPSATPPHTYLPYLVQNWPPIHLLTDAPDNCPGHGPVQFTPHQYRDDFDHQSDQDWYILRATAGVTYTIQTSQLGPNSDTVLELYATDCATLLELHDDIHYPDNVASRITWYAPASGDYHIKVRHYNWTTYGPDTNYTLTIREEQ